MTYGTDTSLKRGSIIPSVAASARLAGALSRLPSKHRAFSGMFARTNQGLSNRPPCLDSAPVLDGPA